jgi:hypothetical protein
VSGFEAALAGAVTVVGVSAVYLGRKWPGPRGKHRAPHPSVRPDRPVQAMELTAALCSTQRVVTIHARMRVNRQLICMDCRQPSPDWQEVGYGRG